MSTINDNVDYDTILLPGDEQNHTKNRFKNPRTQEVNSSRKQENEKSRNNRKQETVKQEPKNPRNQENKKSREVVDGSGRIRRPANITIQDDVKEALNILAVKRHVRPWMLLDQALREFLEKEGIKL